MQLRYITQRYTTLIRVHCATTTTIQLQLQLHYATYATLTTPHHNYNCNCATLITPHYNYNCATPQYIQQLWWGDHCNHSKKHNSNHLSVHQWIRSAIRDLQQPTSIGFLYLKLLRPPCAALLVYIYINTHTHTYIYIRMGQLFGGSPAKVQSSASIVRPIRSSPIGG